jgi:ribosomal protein L7Ae-like RNA K-turn-binding protein
LLPRQIEQLFLIWRLNYQDADVGLRRTGKQLRRPLSKNFSLRAGHQLLKNIKNDVEEFEADKKDKLVVKVKDDLVDQIGELLHKRAMDYVGLANRAGNLIAGFEKARAALKSGKAQILLTANDAADNGRSKMCQGLDNLRVIDIFSREELSKATGLPNAVHIALLPGGISTSLIREISRYERCKK